MAIALFIKISVFKDGDGWKEYKKDMNNYPGEGEIMRLKEFIKSIAS
jgi:hypothetical protein